MGKLIDTIKSITKLQGQMDVATAAENIKNNIQIFGVNGRYVPGSTAGQ